MPNSNPFTRIRPTRSFLPASRPKRGPLVPYLSRPVAPTSTPSSDLVLRQRSQHLLQGRDQPRPLRQPRDIGREAWVGGQFLKSEFLDKPGPLLVAGDANEQLATGSGFEHLVDRPGSPARRHWSRLETGRGH